MVVTGEEVGINGLKEPTPLPGPLRLRTCYFYRFPFVGSDKAC
jgi:hypothetical protein